MFYIFSRLSALLLIIFSASCATDFNLAANQLATQAGLKPTLLKTEPFVLTTYMRFTNNQAPLNVYIEGDGFAWADRNTPSDDPTPHSAIGLKLAVADHSPNVIYLARPCQFTPAAMNPTCADAAYWTNKRFAPEIVAAMNQAITQLVASTSTSGINLIGYSGGAAIAILIAAKRTDVLSLRTVAGNVDSEAVNRFHDVSAMPASLNPITVINQVARIPQIHFSGTEDTVIPSVITQSFVRKIGACAKIERVKGMAHDDDWGARWPALLKQSPGCQTALAPVLP